MPADPRKPLFFQMKINLLEQILSEISDNDHED